MTTETTTANVPTPQENVFTSLETSQGETVAQLDADKNDLASPSGSAATEHLVAAHSAVLTQVSAGVQIIRNGTSIAAQPNSQVFTGDQIVVPENGSAQVLLQGNGDTAFVGTFAPGTAATFGYRDNGSGTDTIAIDVEVGDVEITPLNDDDEAAGIVSNTAGAADASSVGDYVLAGLIGIGAAAAIASAFDDDDDDTPSVQPTTPTTPTEPTGSTEPTVPTMPTEPTGSTEPTVPT
ncbi:hypothetical protein SAMN02745117_02639, partial [Lampropedia hyalina DSM 16112]